MDFVPRVVKDNRPADDSCELGMFAGWAIPGSHEDQVSATHRLRVRGGPLQCDRR